MRFIWLATVVVAVLMIAWLLLRAQPFEAEAGDGTRLVCWKAGAVPDHMYCVERSSRLPKR